MFRISRKLDYGIKLMVALAKEFDGTPIPTAKLSKTLEIPLPFLHQIGHSLMQAGLIKATPGPRGGIRLNKAPDEISVLDVTESLEGKICINSCLSENSDYSDMGDCTSRTMWAFLQDKIVDFLSGINFGDLCQNELIISLIEEGN